MTIIKTANEIEMSQVATEILLGTMYEDRRVNLSITTGSSPIKT